MYKRIDVSGKRLTRKPSSTSKITELVSQGKEMLKIKDYTKASEFFAEVLKLDLKEEKGWIGLTFALLLLGKTEELKTKLLEAKEAKITHSVIYYGLAKIYLKLNDKPALKGIEKEVLVNHPRNAEILRLFADYHYENKNYRKAIVLYERILEQKPDSTDILFICAYIFSNNDEFEKSNLYYTKLLTIAPDSYVSLNNLGTNYSKMNMIKEAMVCYKKSLEIKPDYDLASRNLMIERNNRLFKTMRMTERISMKEMQEILAFDTLIELKEFLIDYISEFYKVHFDEELITFTRKKTSPEIKEITNENYESDDKGFDDSDDDISVTLDDYYDDTSDYDNDDASNYDVESDDDYE